jgi:hypothetical protein
MEGVVLVVLVVVGVLAVASVSIFAFSRRKNDRLRSVRLAAFAAVVTFVAATAGFVVLTRVHHFYTLGRPSPSAGVHVVFTSQTYNPESSLFSLNGSVRGLKPRQELWIVFRGAQRDHLFPASAPCVILPQSQLSCQQNLTGTLNPEVANIKGFLVAAPPKAAAMFRRYDSGSLGTAGLHELPDGATLVSQISVGG